jgi:tRNA pseudouridine(38-40) synthase
MAANMGLMTDALKVKMVGWNKLTDQLANGSVSFELGIRKMPEGSNTNFWVVGGVNKAVTQAERDDNAWVRGPNRFLPTDIAVQWAKPVPDAFHSRTHAVARRYAYVLLESPVRPSVEAGRVGWVFRPLNAAAMQEAAQMLLGEHDFSSFRAAQCQSHTPIKTLHRLHISQRGALWRFEFEANAFLHHMIRNLMGCLISIGQGMHPPSWMQEVLHARSRAVAAVPPHGGLECDLGASPRAEARACVTATPCACATRPTCATSAP